MFEWWHVRVICCRRYSTAMPSITRCFVNQNVAQCACPSGYTGPRCEQTGRARISRRILVIRPFQRRAIDFASKILAYASKAARMSLILKMLILISNAFSVRCISNATAIRCICRPGTEGQYCEKNTTSKGDMTRGEINAVRWSTSSFMFGWTVSEWWRVNESNLRRSQIDWIQWLRCLVAISMVQDTYVPAWLRTLANDVKRTPTVISSVPRYSLSSTLLIETVANLCTANPNYCRNGGT